MTKYLVAGWETGWWWFFDAGEYGVAFVGCWTLLYARIHCIDWSLGTWESFLFEYSRIRLGIDQIQKGHSLGNAEAGSSKVKDPVFAL